VSDHLSYDLHALVAKLDRSADRILQAEAGVSYRRFLVLFMVRELGATTQRALAEKLDVSDPSISRMTGVLADAGMLVAAADPAGGNRRRLRLTRDGDRLVDECRAILVDRFRSVLERSGIDVAGYAAATTRLLDVLQQDEGPAAPRRAQHATTPLGAR
jgi:DNA-binding MarR family transcriptional regulator